MKCIQNLSDEEIRRVGNDWAKELADSGKWKFIKKSQWKTEVRDFNPIKVAVVIHTAESIEKGINNQRKADARKQKKEYQKTKRNYRTN